MTARRDPAELLLHLRGQPPRRLAWGDLFGNDRPVELEIGSGKGLFLAESAARRPECNFVGVELSLKYARKSAERAAKHEVENVRVIHDDGKRVLRECVQPASLAAIHVYFPDPWWKKRHRKRRVFTADLVAGAALALVAQGELRLATDVEEYFHVMMELVAESSAFAPLDDTAFGLSEGGFLTSFERKYRTEGRSIFRAACRRIAGDP